MSKGTALVIMAAGVGSRFGGGIKQLEPIGPNGEIIMDYSVHDAITAGFRKLIFVIRREIEADFQERIGSRIESVCRQAGVEVCYAYQELDKLPEGFALPAGRIKPWGTGQAVLAAEGCIREPFAVINADDYYGPDAFRRMQAFLETVQAGNVNTLGMVAFSLENTLSRHGGVTRGVCQVDSAGRLLRLHETPDIQNRNGSAYAGEEKLDGQLPVSMNMWGFAPEFLETLKQGFTEFLNGIQGRETTAEFLLPVYIDRKLKEGAITVKVMRTDGKWLGMTYREDTEAVQKEMETLYAAGVYRKNLYADVTGHSGRMALVTGGTGYIGSHTCVELLKAGYGVVIVDNLSNSKREVLNRIEQITGKRPTFYQVDLLDKAALETVFQAEEIDYVIHFAGLKAVGESVRKPLTYYHNNITGTLHLCELMQKYQVKNLIFSSSATVYGDPETIPITEACPMGKIASPYGRTKAMLEQILTDMHTADPEWNIVLLRYFNPIGAHESGLIGEDPQGIPNNLLPYIAQVAVGKLEKLGVFGNDYDTPDGTGVRDYIHVVDLAIGHVKALKKLEPGSGVSIYNLGTGKGYSVMEVLHAYEKACGRQLPYEIKPRRAGDVAAYYCDPNKAREELGWSAERDIEAMCADSWRWQSGNPDGYREE